MRTCTLPISYEGMVGFRILPLRNPAFVSREGWMVTRCKFLQLIHVITVPMLPPMSVFSFVGMERVGRNTSQEVLSLKQRP